MELLPILLMPVFLALVIYQTLEGRKRVKRELRNTFLALRFTTPGGVAGGDAMRVIKVYKQGVPFIYDDVFNLPVGPRHISDSFWYCVGPGPSYFLAIPLVEAGLGRVKVSWVVRPLSAERMHAALVDDEHALREAFGPNPGDLLA
nr:hypothetical protein [Lysobacter terrestris]